MYYTPTSLKGETMCKLNTCDQDICVEMRGIEKSFHGSKVNDDIHFVLRKQEIHALLGENGAGKTTLMNILYGLYQAERGEIFIEGNCLNISDPLTAISHGIGMVHQHFMLVDTLTVYENIILGSEETKAGFLHRDVSQKRIEKIIEDSGLVVDLDAKIHTLPIGAKQRVEILKVLYKGAKILILDEPTAVLTPQETDELFVILRRLRENGTSIVLITHKMRETFAVSDQITVMRKGKIIESVKTSDTDPSRLAMSMVGRGVQTSGYEKSNDIGEVLVRVDHLSTSIKGLKNLQDISFGIRKGQIFGIAGVDGNGQSQLVDVLIGVTQPYKGQIYLGDKDITKTGPDRQVKYGVAVIPEDRNSMGLVANFTVTENLFLGKQRTSLASKRGFLKLKNMEETADACIKEFDICPAKRDLLAKGFSGGNQQKIIVARELTAENIQLVIAVQPTRGLDIGATEFVHKQLMKMRDEGKAILLISTELDEVCNLSDQIAVMYEGKILADRAAQTYSEEELGLLMAGKMS